MKIMNKWSKRSLRNLKTCHEDLQLLANTVLRMHDCTVICGHRNEQEQNEAYYKGASKVKFPNSNHNFIISRAIDLAPYKKGASLYDRENVLYFAGIVITAAQYLYDLDHITHKIRWGGDWDGDNNFKEHKFFDGVHFELIE